MRSGIQREEQVKERRISKSQCDKPMEHSGGDVQQAFGMKIKIHLLKTFTSRWQLKP
jgi:hypothetical protein